MARKGKMHRSESDKRQSANYSYEANRRKRLEREAAKQPNNEQVQRALGNIHYRPETPRMKMGWVSRKDPMIVGFESRKGVAGRDPVKGKADTERAAWASAHARRVARELEYEQKKRRRQKDDERHGKAKQTLAGIA